MASYLCSSSGVLRRIRQTLEDSRHCPSSPVMSPTGPITMLVEPGGICSVRSLTYELFHRIHERATNHHIVMIGERLAMLICSRCVRVSDIVKPRVAARPSHELAK